MSQFLWKAFHGVTHSFYFSFYQLQVVKNLPIAFHDRTCHTPPKLSVSQFMGYLKGKSALMIFENHANLKYKYGQRTFWARGYYVSTVGLNKNTIKKYIREQETEDMLQDKRSVKGYEDPFKGC